MLVPAQLLGLMAMQPPEERFQKKRIVSINGIVEVLPDVPFKIMIECYGQNKYRINKNQIFILLIKQRSELTISQIPISEIINM